MLPLEGKQNLDSSRTKGHVKYFHGLSSKVLALTARQNAVHLRLGEPAHLAVQVCITTPQITQRAETDDDRRPRQRRREFQKLHMSTMVSEAAGEM